MANQIPADLAKRLHELVGKWETSASLVIENDVGATLDQCADELRDLLPPSPSPRPTMADMTYEERAACQWMQCDVIGFRGKYTLISPSDWDGDAVLLGREGEVHYEDHAMVVPRPDLPRLEWPGQQPDPAPVPEPIANMREEWGVKWDDDPHGPPDWGLATRAAAEKWEKEKRHYGPKRGRIVRRVVGPWKEA